MQINIGKVGRAFGIQGAVKIHLLNADSDTLQPGLWLELRREKFLPQRYQISQVKDGGRVWLTGLESRNDAELLTGAEVWVSRDDLPELGEEEAYLIDLIGYRVVTREDKALGSVSGFSDNNAQILVEIETTDSLKIEVPFIPQFIVDIYDDDKVIVMDLPEGFF